MKKYLIYLLIWAFSLPTYAMSTAIVEDGIARVTLKDNYPCVYLNNGKKIRHMQFSGQKSPQGFTPTTPDGSSREQCVPFDGGQGVLEYNTLFEVFLNDKENQSLDDAHMLSFCIRNQNNQLRLVSVGRNGCSEQDWKPHKFYSGLFGKIEQFIDWLFNLNGYTKETF